MDGSNGTALVLHHGFCRVRVSLSGEGGVVSRQDLALEDAIGSHAYPLEANMYVIQWHLSRASTL